MGKEVICLDKVSKSFKKERVIKEITLTIEEGKIYGLIGRNGSGKTVLIKMICGFMSPDSGVIEVQGKTLDKKSDFPENIGVLIESPGFLPTQSGFKNLKYLAGIRKLITDDDIKGIMTEVGLDWRSRKWVGRYSMGMRQRLGIAQAIMEDPDIVLLDEPMNGLDEQGVEDMRKLLTSLKERGKTVILASHNKEDIQLLCDVVLEMKNGELSERVDFEKEAKDFSRT